MKCALFFTGAMLTILSSCKIEGDRRSVDPAVPTKEQPEIKNESLAERTGSTKCIKCKAEAKAETLCPLCDACVSCCGCKLKCSLCILGTSAPCEKCGGCERCHKSCGGCARKCVSCGTPTKLSDLQHENSATRPGTCKKCNMKEVSLAMDRTVIRSLVIGLKTAVVDGRDGIVQVHIQSLTEYGDLALPILKEHLAHAENDKIREALTEAIRAIGKKKSISK